MPKIGEFASLRSHDEADMFFIGVVVSLAPLILAQRLDFMGRDPTRPQIEYPCEWDEREIRKELVEFSGQMFVESKEEALTHIDKYVREVIASRME